MNQFDSIPDELRRCKQWLNWRGKVQEDERQTKVPYGADGQMADVTDPEAYMTFDEARLCSDHVGFAFTPDDPYCGIDLDKCRDSVTGEVEPWALDIVHDLNSYTEVSHSERGLHVFVKAQLSPGGRRKGQIEMYDRDRYFCMTGNLYDGSPATIEERQEAVNALHAELFAKAAEKQPPPLPVAPTCLADDEVLAKARTASNSDRFDRLWRGDTDSFPSPSEADLALCCHLAFWCSRDPVQMKRLLNQSGRVRDKWVSKRGNSTWIDHEIDNAIALCQKVYTPQKAEHTYNDKGNAGRLADHLSDNVRYVVESKQFYFYAPETGLYSPDNDGRMTRETLKMVDDIRKEGAGKDKEGVKQVLSWAKQSGNGQRIREAIKLYSSFEGVSLTLETLRADPDAAPCLNGVVDLTTGKLLEPDRSRFYLHQFQVEYDPKATCPLFLAKALPVWFPDDGTRDWYHRFLGACATGHYVPFFVVNEGSGGEGKTVLTEVITGIFGSFSVHLPVSALLVKYGINSEDYALAKVKGARILFASEPGERSRLDEAAIKKLTGGDTLTGRFPGGRYFDFLPEHGLILNTNHLLRAGETTHAFWRRVRRVRWTNPIPESSKIDEFAARLLRDEAPGILNWLLGGAREYYTRGLDDIPAEIKCDTDEYRRDQDVLGRWFDECCVPDPSSSEPTTLLYESLKLWARENGEIDKTKEISLTALGTWLGKHEPPFEADKSKRPVRRRGLRLTDYWKPCPVGSGDSFTVDLESFESAKEDN